MFFFNNIRNISGNFSSELAHKMLSIFLLFTFLFGLQIDLFNNASNRSLNADSGAIFSANIESVIDLPTADLPYGTDPVEQEVPLEKEVEGAEQEKTFSHKHISFCSEQVYAAWHNDALFEFASLLVQHRKHIGLYVLNNSWKAFIK
jgi:hypothetical protein